MSAFKTVTTDNAIVSTTLTFPNRITAANLPTGGANKALITNGAGTDPLICDGTNSSIMISMLNVLG